MAVLSPSDMLGVGFQPKTKNRFLFYVEGIPTFMIKGSTIPGFEMGEIQLNHLNSYKKVAGGRQQWNDITIRLFDPISPSGQQTVMQWANLCAEAVTGRHGYADFYKKDCTISLVGPVGDVVGEWIIKGAFIKSTDFGDLSFDDAEAMVELSVTLAYDYAVLNF